MTLIVFRWSCSSETLLVFFLPQVINFVYSVPQVGEMSMSESYRIDALLPGILFLSSA